MNLKHIRQLIFGQDIFISHRWTENSKKYALKLAEELEKRGLDCFIDYNEIHAGDSIPALIQLAIKRSRMFILITHRDVLGSTWIPKEIRLADNGKRKIIPLNIDGMIDNFDLTLPEWKSLNDRDRIEESLESFESATPSPEVLSEIDQTFNARRNKSKATNALFMLALFVLLATFVPAGFALYVRQQAEEQTKNLQAQAEQALKELETANAEKNQAKTDLTAAQKERESALKDVDRFKKEKDLAEKDLNQAKLETSAAQEQTKVAQIEQATAENNARQQEAFATENRREAAKQGKIADSRTFLARAEQEKYQDNEPFIGPLKSAIRAWEIFPSFEPDAILRYGLERTPRPLNSDRINFAGEVEKLALSEDGRFLTTIGKNFKAHVWDLSNQEENEPLDLGANVANTELSSNGEYLAVVDKNNEKKVRLLELNYQNKGLITELELGAKIGKITFSANNQNIAMNDTTGKIYIWKIEKNAEATVNPRRLTVIKAKPFAAASDDCAKNSRYIDEMALNSDASLIGVTLRCEDKDDDEEVIRRTQILKTDSGEKIYERGGGGYLTFSNYSKYFAFSPYFDEEPDTASYAINLETVNRINEEKRKKNEELKNFDTTNKDTVESPALHSDCKVNFGYEELESFSTTNEDSVESLALFSVDSDDGMIFLVAGDSSGQVKFHLLKDTEEEITPSTLNHTNKVSQIMFKMPFIITKTEKKYVITEEDKKDNTLHLWQFNRRSEKSPQFYESMRIPNVASFTFNENANSFATVDSQGKLHLWEQRTNGTSSTEMAVLKYSETVFGVDGRFMLFATEDKTIIWDNFDRTTREIEGNHFEDDDFRSDNDEDNVFLSSDARYLIGGSPVKIFDLKASSATPQTTLGNKAAKIIGYSRQDGFLATRGKDKQIYLWNNYGAQELRKVSSQAEVEKVIFSAKGKYFATLDGYKLLSVEKTSGGGLLVQPAALNKETFIFSPDESFYAAAEDTVVRIRETETGKPAVPDLKHPLTVKQIYYSPDGEYLVTVCGENIVKLWNRRGDEIKLWKQNKLQSRAIEHTSYISDIIWSRKLKYFAILSGDNVKVFKTTSGEQIGIDYKVKGIRRKQFAFSPNEEYLAMTPSNIDDGNINSEDRTVSVFKISDSQKAARMEFKDYINYIAFTPDGQLLTVITDTDDMFNKGNQYRFHQILWQTNDLINESCFRLKGFINPTDNICQSSNFNFKN